MTSDLPFFRFQQPRTAFYSRLVWQSGYKQAAAAGGQRQLIGEEDGDLHLSPPAGPGTIASVVFLASPVLTCCVPGVAASKGD